jgi:endonuclease YncB( thermonuclease family)
MFGWGRKSDGFEWHKYVRTTIKLRREDRRKKVEEIRALAVEGARNAGQAGAAAGQSILARAWQVLSRLPGATLRGLGWLGGKLSPALKAAARGLSAPAGPIVAVTRRPGIAPLVLLVGLAAAASAAARWWTAGLDLQTFFSAGFAIIACGLAAVSLFGRLPRMPKLAGTAIRLPAWPVGATWPRRLILGAIVGVLAIGGTVAAWSYLPSIAPLRGAATSIAKLSPFKKETIAGTARAITGDTLSIDGRYVRLAGIEAPELAQNCQNSNGRRWRCGRAARSHLARLVSRKSVTCEANAAKPGDIGEGTCMIGEKDVARAMVEIGGAFAVGGLYARYGASEREARSRKRGIWRGTAERPEVFRASLWDSAKRDAPDGCPIKGHVSSKGKIYLVPWSPNYRRERINTQRGERWFCSESDAVAAGWRPDPAG